MKFFVLFLFPIVVLLAQVDINHANKGELMTLKNIGAAKAEAIIEYRKKQCINSLEELMQIKGIGEATIAKNKEAIVIRSCKK